MLGGILLSLALAAGYVAPLHLLSGSRDDIKVIRSRMACISAYCCVAWIPVYMYVKPEVRSLACDIAQGGRGVLPHL